ncbi:MAG: class I SAM-dependent methyltransferase [Phycisphaerae bacterium]
MIDATPSYRTIRQIVRNLDELAGLERVWPRGAVHPGGPHYRLKGTLGPISIGEDECGVIGRLIQKFRPARCFMIGNGFGLSSAYIAKMMEQNAGRSVVTLDNQSEGQGARCAQVADQLRQRMDCTLLTSHKGTSPQDIEPTAGDERYDFVFIDGLHRHPQVTCDFQTVQRIAANDAIFCWHDYWMPGIPQCVEYAQQTGYHCLKVNSSCEMAFGTKSDTVFNEIGKLYDNAEPPRPRLRPGAFFKLCYVLLTGTIKARVAAAPPAK